MQSCERILKNPEQVPDPGTVADLTIWEINGISNNGRPYRNMKDKNMEGNIESVRTTSVVDDDW